MPARMTSIATDPATPSGPPTGKRAPISGVGGAAASRFIVKTTPKAMRARGPPIRERQRQEGEGRERIALVHRRQEAERDEHRRGEPERQRLRGVRAR